MSAKEVIAKLATTVLATALKDEKDWAGLYRVGHEMRGLSEAESAALIDILEDWAGTR